MHAVIRAYTGPNAAQFIDALDRRKDELERLFTAIDGFVSYTLVRTNEGGISISVYQTRDGADESSHRAWSLVESSMSPESRVTPTISDGAVLLHRDAH
jgi:hypothetical protein